jgi:hypothetical protein
MADPRRIARLFGPTIVALFCRKMNSSTHLYDLQIPPVVYLSLLPTQHYG